MKKISIFEYIKTHMGNDGFFASPVLPDDPEPEISYLLGDEEGHYFTTGIPKDRDSADQLLAELRQYAAFPTEENRQQIENTLSNLIMIEILYSFSQKFTNEDYNNNILILAQELFYNSSCRQALKLAYLLFSCYGLTNIKKNNPELWQDLLLAARCEEFTYFFILAAKSDLPELQKELWEIIYHTKNWGRVFALEEAIATTHEQKLWCIENALDTQADYPPLSVKIILECELTKELTAADVSYPIYNGAASAILNFLELLTSYDLQKLEKFFPVSKVDLPPLLHEFFRHARCHAVSPETLLPIIFISEQLQQLIDNGSWLHLSANQCHAFVAACDSIIYQKDWSTEVQAQLFDENGKINHLLCDFAKYLDLDIWQPVFEYFTDHYEDNDLLSYLLGGSEEQTAEVLAVIEQHLDYYMFYPLTLLTPLAYLQENPGKGESILLRLLQSQNEMLIGMAYHVLRDWPYHYLTLPLKKAIVEAQSHIQSSLHREMLDSLLQDDSTDNNNNLM